MKVIEGKKKYGGLVLNLVLKILILLFVFYIAFMLVGQYIKIERKKSELENINSLLEMQNIENNELKKVTQASDEENEEYFIRVARELNFSKPNERTFVNVSGN